MTWDESKYMDGSEQKCPNCGADSVYFYFGKTENSPPTMEQYVSCEACNAWWVEEYRLVAVDQQWRV